MAEEEDRLAGTTLEVTPNANPACGTLPSVMQASKWYTLDCNAGEGLQGSTITLQTVN